MLTYKAVEFELGQNIALCQKKENSPNLETSDIVPLLQAVMLYFQLRYHASINSTIVLCYFTATFVASHPAMAKLALNTYLPHCYIHT